MLDKELNTVFQCMTVAIRGKVGYDEYMSDSEILQTVLVSTF